MLLYERETRIPPMAEDGNPIEYFQYSIDELLPVDELPVRFAVTKSGPEGYNCELGVLADMQDCSCAGPNRLFDFVPRDVENTEQFNVVLLVPTGIGAEIGGHAGDAGPVARLLASVCDTLITHPNVVNASDINELPENGLYVEGSVICRMLMGTAALRKVRSNRILLVMDEHTQPDITELVINSASAARATSGMECPCVVKMDPPIDMRAKLSSSGSAVGRVEGLQRLCEVLAKYRDEYDAVALSTLIHVPEGIHEEYFGSDGSMVNPWGGVEAMLTHTISSLFDVPSAHAPMMESLELLGKTFGVVDPRMSAEAVSRCFIHCVLKGLHRSPRIVIDPDDFGRPGVLSAADVSCLVIPDGCVGLPTLAAIAQGIPVIAVRENRNCMRNDLRSLPFEKGMLTIVDNYLEAVGVLAAMKSGLAASSVRRPLKPTVVECVKHETPEGCDVADQGFGDVDSCMADLGDLR